MNASIKNIMIVDDDNEDHILLQDGLSLILSNLKITNLYHGNDCLKLLRNGFKPDIIFMDLTMPGKNGLECLRDIYSEDLIKETPIIIYSSSHNMKDIAASSEYGARFYLVKPGSIKILSSLIKHIIFLLGESLAEQLKKENFVIREQKLLEV